MSAAQPPVVKPSRSPVEEAVAALGCELPDLVSKCRAMKLNHPQEVLPDFRDILDKLNPLLQSAQVAIATLRSPLQDIAEEKGPYESSQTLILLDLAHQFRDGLINLSKHFRDRQEKFDFPEQWLAHLELALRRIGLLVDCGRDPPQLPKALEWELSRALKLVSANRSRIWCDVETRSVWLDGTLLASGIELHPFRFFRQIVESDPEPIPFKKMSGLKGKNQNRDLKDKLPLKVKQLFIAGRRGHSLKLSRPS